MLTRKNILIFTTLILSYMSIFATQQTGKVTEVCYEKGQNRLWFFCSATDQTRHYINTSIGAEEFNRFYTMLVSAKVSGCNIIFDDANPSSWMIIKD